MPKQVAVPDTLKQLSRRTFSDVATFWANAAPSDSRTFDEVVPLDDWPELQRALANGTPDPEIELGTSFLAESECGLRKTRSWIDAASLLNSQGFEHWSYVAAYEAALSGVITFSLLFGWHPIRNKKANRYHMIDLAPAFRDRSREWDLLNGSNVHQKEWWAIARAICLKTESWPSSVKSEVCFLKDRNHDVIAYTRNALQYQMSQDLIKMMLRSPFSGQLRGALLLSDHLKPAPLQVQPTKQRESLCCLEEFNCIRRLLRFLVDEIVQLRRNDYTLSLADIVSAF